MITTLPQKGPFFQHKAQHNKCSKREACSFLWERESLRQEQYNEEQWTLRKWKLSQATIQCICGQNHFIISFLLTEMESLYSESFLLSTKFTLKKGHNPKPVKNELGNNMLGQILVILLLMFPSSLFSPKESPGWQNTPGLPNRMKSGWYTKTLTVLELMLMRYALLSWELPSVFWQVILVLPSDTSML